MAAEVPSSEGHIVLFGDPTIGTWGHIEVVITVSGDSDHTPSFQAPGLTLGGRHGWTYEYHFTDIGK